MRAEVLDAQANWPEPIQQQQPEQLAQVARKLARMLVVLRCEDVVLRTARLDDPTPAIHLSIERLLSFLPNVAVIGHGSRAMVRQALCRAGMLSYFREDTIFGTERLSHAQADMEQYLLPAQELGYFKSNTLIIESADCPVRDIKFAGMQALRFVPEGASGSDDAFATVSDFVRLMMAV